MNLKVMTALTATAALAGCMHIQTSEQQQQEDISQFGYAIHSGSHYYDHVPGLAGYFAVFDVSVEQAPRIIDIHRERPVVEDWKDKEILLVSGDLSEVQPDWRTWHTYNPRTETFMCWKGSFNIVDNHSRNDYNPCDSTLSKSSVNIATVHNTLYNFVATLGIGALTGTAQYAVSIDKTKVAALIERTQMMAAIETMERETAAREAHAEQVRALLAEQDRQERERQRQIEAEAMERHRQQAAIERQQREVEYTRWRRTLAVGSSTFCGPVIERRGDMVHIAVNTPLPGYAAEQWLKVEEVYPPRLGCRNINGTLHTVVNP